ncbi:UTR6 [Symbiodinium microadriaticum]|nr:UTR6 [Symbiodinium microadriaticum]CAE7884776.1 UTR6 [Symbiodinium sp. KB8]
MARLRQLCLLCLALVCSGLLAQSKEACVQGSAHGASLAQLWIRRAGAFCEADLSELRTVTLLVHCRQTREVCELRRPLILSYRPFFREVRWLLSWPNSTGQLRAEEHLCEKPGDPYLCVTQVGKQLERDGTASTGILYMHFDAVLAPCSFAQRFDARKIGTFGSKAQLRWDTFEGLDRCNGINAVGFESLPNLHCPWHLWESNRLRLRDALAELRHAGVLSFPAELSQGCWTGYDDLFYLPWPALHTYGVLAEIFARHNVHHEIAGPTALAVASLNGLEMQDFGCKVGVLNPLTLRVVTAPDFVCGHEVHYQEEGMVEAVEAVIKGNATLLLQAANEQRNFLHILDWGVWGELPAMCILLGAGLALCLCPDTRDRVLFSYIVCAIYVLISVVIDLSMAVQSIQAPHEDYKFEPMCAVLLTELLKLVVSLCLILYAQCSHRSTQTMPSAEDVAWLVLPAAIFTLNNILVWWSIGRNDISTFGVFRDTMILWTAFLWRMVFGVPLGPTRLLAIAVLVFGLALNQLENLLQSRFSWPLLLVLLMTACNAMGSVVNEFALKRRDGMDINVQNAILYAAAVVFTALLILVSGRVRGLDLYKHGIFQGFTRHTMFTVIMQAFAGLAVSRILKYSDAVQKNIAACLRGPILVVISPAFVRSSANMLTFVSAAIVASGCVIYLHQGPLSASNSSKDKSRSASH